MNVNNNKFFKITKRTEEKEEIKIEPKKNNSLEKKKKKILARKKELKLLKQKIKELIDVIYGKEKKIKDILQSMKETTDVLSLYNYLLSSFSSFFMSGAFIGQYLAYPFHSDESRYNPLLMTHLGIQGLIFGEVL
ncbi:hypothetical protein ACFL2K_02130 [Candidatus Margulisiibacteriota bacterium]